MGLAVFLGPLGQLEDGPQVGAAGVQQYDADDPEKGGLGEQRVEHDKAEDLIRPVLPAGSQVLGAGGCNVCKKCAFPEPCRFPEKAKTSVEACGINVVSLAKTAKINYTNGENTVTYFTLVFLGGSE